jgi:hypothetical protein
MIPRIRADGVKWPKLLESLVISIFILDPDGAAAAPPAQKKRLFLRLSMAEASTATIA